MGLQNVPAELAGCVLSIGNFDGVHLGHQRLIERARALADQAGAAAVAMTFDPTPDLVLRPADQPQRLATLDERCRLLHQAGAHVVVVARPDQAFLAQSADQFIQSVIRDRFAPRRMVEGPDFCFGRGRQGNIQALQQAQLSVEVVESRTIDIHGQTQRISSTLIRRLLLAGAVEDAARCLGRAYCLTGHVVRGQGRGRVLSFPTANLDCPQQVIPADGIYAGLASIEGPPVAAAISIGVNPTVGPVPRTVEAFLLEGSGEYYGRQMRLQFVGRLRDQRKFETVEALREQIAKDVQHVRQLIRQ